MKLTFRLILIGVVCMAGISPSNALAQQQVNASKTTHDGSHDFDFEIGLWKTSLKRLQHPLTRSNTWVEYSGTTTVSKVWNGRANLVELDVTGSSGHIEALSLRLYNAQTGQWSLNFSGVGSGSISQPTIGEFKNGHGEFFDQELLMADIFWCVLLFRGLVLMYAILNSLFRMTAAKPGN